MRLRVRTYFIFKISILKVIMNTIVNIQPNKFIIDIIIIGWNISNRTLSTNELSNKRKLV